MIKNLETGKKELSARKNNSRFLVTLILLTIVAGSGGWFIGKHFDIFIKSDFSEKLTDKSMQKRVDSIIEQGNITVLPPIITNLIDPEGARIRLELALVSKKDKEISSELAAEISGDFLAYLNQNTLSQVKGSMGLMYLREDLLERAIVRSGGKVVQVFLTGLVIDE